MCIRSKAINLEHTDCSGLKIYPSLKECQYLIGPNRNRSLRMRSLSIGTIEFPKLIVYRHIGFIINLPAPVQIKAIAMIHVGCNAHAFGNAVARRLLNSGDQRAPQITAF